jgi:signal transduction histidine kinase
MDIGRIARPVRWANLANRSGITFILLVMVSWIALQYAKTVDREAERSTLIEEAAKYESVMQTEVQHLIDLLYRSSEWSFSPQAPAIANSFPWVRGIELISESTSDEFGKYSIVSLSLAESSRSLGGQVTYSTIDQSEIVLVLAKADKDHTVRAIFSIPQLLDFMNQRVSNESLNTMMNWMPLRTAGKDHRFIATLQLGLPGLEFDVEPLPTKNSQVSVNETFSLTLVLIGFLWTIWLLLVNERRRRLRYLNQLNDQKERIAAHANRLTLAEIASSLGHEINQPVAVIESLADSAAFLIDKGDYKTAAETLRKIQTATIRIGHIIQSIRRLSSHQNPHFETIDLRIVINEIEPFLKMICKHAELKVVINSPRQPIEVSVDRTGIEQIITNLITNADEANSEEHTRQPRRPATTLELTSTDQHAIIRISDHGSGIPLEIQQRIFEAFATTKPHGVGLGLNLSRSIAERHRGWLDVVETSASGTTFELRLPRASANMDQHEYD